MNETLNLLYQRKSTRAFLEKQIPKEAKEAILKSAMQAPTAGNQMLYTVLDITDKSIKERLAQTCDNQPFIAKADMVLVFLADYKRWHDTFRYAGCEIRKPLAGELLLSTADAIIAAHSAVVAAESLGIGSCYIGDVLEKYEAHVELFNLPDYVYPAAMVVFGYPTESQTARVKPPRFDSKYIVFENTYKTLDKNEHIEMYQERASRSQTPAKPFEQSVQEFCNRKFMSEFSLEMSRSAEKYVNQWLNK